MNESVGLRARLQSLDERLTSPLTIPRARRGALAAALAFAHSGDSYIWGALMVAAWFLGDHAWKVRALAGVIGLVLVEVVVIALKMVIRRPRPPGESGRIYRRADPFSFPSGHAARAALLCILAWQLGPAAAAAVISAWGPVMVASRVAVGIHYVLDVAAGILLGVCLTAILLRVLPLIAERV
jgi:undecaprenyl-diphosphatase